MFSPNLEVTDVFSVNGQTVKVLSFEIHRVCCNQSILPSQGESSHR